jgi:hypothetical protein
MKAAVPPFPHMTLWCVQREVRYIFFVYVLYEFILNYNNRKGHAMAQFVEALHYKPEDRGFDSR